MCLLITEKKIVQIIQEFVDTLWKSCVTKRNLEVLIICNYTESAIQLFVSLVDMVQRLIVLGFIHLFVIIRTDLMSHFFQLFYKIWHRNSHSKLKWFKSYNCVHI